MSMNDIFHNPAFKKDFAFIRQLESRNKAYQDKIWEKFVGEFGKNDEDSSVRIVNTRFESHPSGLSSESEKSVHVVQEYWDNEASFKLSNSSLELKSFTEKSKSKSLSGTKILVNDTQRKKLRKKLTKHLQNGTLDKFEVKNIGDHAPKNRKKETSKIEEKPEEIEADREVYLDRWSRSNSKVSLKEQKSQLEEIPQTGLEYKLSEEIERLKAQLKMREQMGNKSNKSKTKGHRSKFQGTKENRKFAMDVNATTELRKSKYYIEKCIGVLKELGMIMDDGILPPDGSDDYARRQVRTKEFTSRFSRIYLYPLLTQLSKLSGSERCSTIYSRFTSLYQLIYQALQACFNHLPNAVGNASHHKLRECLNCAVEICDRSRKQFENEVNYDNEDYVCILKSHCTDLSNKIEENFLSISAASLLYSKSTRTSLVPAQQSNRNSTWKNENDRKNLSKRFSMYSSSLAQKRDKQWRKMLDAFELKKPKVKSRYRTATFKHRPPMEKTNNFQEVMQPKQHRLDDKRSLVLLRNTPVVTPINEDNIQTMVQYEKERKETEEQDSEKEIIDEEDKEDDEEQDDKLNTTFFVEGEVQDTARDVTKQHQEDILTKLLQLVQDGDEKPVGGIDANLTNTIMVLQKCLSLKNQNAQTRMKSDNVQDQQVLSVRMNAMEISSDVSEKKSKKEPKITVIGERNAQLICIKDDNSVISVNNEKSNDAEKNLKTTEVQTCESLVTEEDVPSIRRSRSSIKISRVKRPRRLLELLPKAYAINIIQYKLMFYKHHKGNYMYKKTSTTKPWELIDKISEDILDYALLGIAKEIEITELLENIYNAEFQY